ncbi:MAG: SGNH/GDSL hydrolase family protein, partial [Planctomycetota bacterium]
MIKVLAIGFICFVSLEVVTRAFFAIQLGPRALAYGTPWFRQEISVAKKKAQNWKSDVEGTGTGPGLSHDNVVSEYSKYFPNEVKRDVDPNGVPFELQINNNGFRGPNYSQQKKSGVIRVLTLGASSTFGFGSRDEETYPIYLEQMLNEECEAEYEVINLGIPHLTSASILSLFEAEAVPLDPDVVTFYEGINDSSASATTFSVENMKHAVRHSWVSTIYKPLIAIYRTTRDLSMFVLLVDNMLQSSDRSTKED